MEAECAMNAIYELVHSFSDKRGYRVLLDGKRPGVQKWKVSVVDPRKDEVIAEAVGYSTVKAYENVASALHLNEAAA